MILQLVDDYQKLRYSMRFMQVAVSSCTKERFFDMCLEASSIHFIKKKNHPDNKVRVADVGPNWGRQDPGGPHAGPMYFVIWAVSPTEWIYDMDFWR